MSLRFRYRLDSVPHPIPSLGGRRNRPRPMVPVTLVGPLGTFRRQCLLDTGADDTVFSETVAGTLGIDLTNASELNFTAVGGIRYRVRFAEIFLQVTDGIEQREWKAWIGFTSARLIQPLLGFAGFLQFFTATFHGDHEEVELTVNSLYQGS